MGKMARIGKKAKSGKGVFIILLLMVIIGVMVGFGLYTYLEQQRTVIYVFSGDYPAGTPVSGTSYTTLEIDTAAYGAMTGTGTSYCTAEELRTLSSAGDRLAVDVVAGLPATTNLFMMTGGGTGVESKLKDGKAACEILASRVYGLTGSEVRPDSRVNIVAFSDIEDVERSELIYQDMLVLDVIRDEAGETTAIYVECDPSDLVTLQHALVADTVSLSVLKPGTYTEVTDEAGLVHTRVTRQKQEEEPAGGR